jgi:hypothetical protein
MSSAKEEFGIELLLGNIPASSSHFINFYFSGTRQHRVGGRFLVRHGAL